MKSREFKNENRIDVFYGCPLFSIQAHAKNIKKRQENTCKFEIVFQHENPEFLLQNQFMQ